MKNNTFDDISIELLSELVSRFRKNQVAITIANNLKTEEVDIWLKNIIKILHDKAEAALTRRSS